MGWLTTRIRRMLELASRGRVLRRRLPSAFGRHPIYVTPEGGLRYWRRDLGRVDPPLLAFAAEHVSPGDVVWDVGAHVGLFAFAAAARAGATGRVLAIEADVWLASLIVRSRRLQPATSAPVEVLPVAVSDEVGLAEFHVASRSRASSSLAGAGGSQAGGVRERMLVPTLPLDWLLERSGAPRVVKIDVEGFEARLLAASPRLLGEARPVLHCEVSAENARAATEILHCHRYRLFDGDLPAGARRPLDAAAWNTLALPEERI